MSIKLKKLKNHNLKLMLNYVNKDKKVFKKIGTFNFKTYNVSIDYMPYVLQNGTIVSNSFFKLLNNFKTKQWIKIKYKWKTSDK